MAGAVVRELVAFRSDPACVLAVTPTGFLFAFRLLHAHADHCPAGRHAPRGPLGSRLGLDPEMLLAGRDDAEIAATSLALAAVARRAFPHYLPAGDLLAYRPVAIAVGTDRISLGRHPVIGRPAASATPSQMLALATFR